MGQIRHTSRLFSNEIVSTTTISQPLFSDNPIPLKLQPLFDFQPNETKADLNQQTGEVGLMFYYPLIIVQYTICLEKRHWQIILRH